MFPIYKMPYAHPPQRQSYTFEELNRLVIQHGLSPASGVKTSPNTYIPQMTAEQRYSQNWSNTHLAPEISRVPDMSSHRLTPELGTQRATPEMVRLDPSVVASYLNRHVKSPPPSTGPTPHLSHHLAAPPQAMPQGMFVPQGVTALTQGIRREDSPRPSQPYPRQTNRSPAHARTSALSNELQKSVANQPWPIMPQSNYLASHPVYSRQVSAPGDLRDLSKIHVPPTQIITNNNSVNQNANVSQLMAALNVPSQFMQAHGATGSLQDMASLQQQFSSIPPHELNKLIRLLRNGPGGEYPHREELPYPDLERQSPEPPVLARAETLPQSAAGVYGQYGESNDYCAPTVGRSVNANPFFPPGMKVETKEHNLLVPDVRVEDENGRQVPVPVCEEENKLETRSNPFSMRVDILNKFPNTTSSSRYRSQAIALHRAKAGCILGAPKSLDLLRQNLQKGFNKELDDLITGYIEMFFKPACDNIRRNQGESAINGEHLLAIRRQLLDDAKKMYCDNESIAPGEVSDNVSEAGSHHDTRKKQLYFGRRRKHSDSDSEASQPLSLKKKKGRSAQSGRCTPSKGIKEPVRREGPKWDPARVTSETLFVMGAKANKALGLGNTRGRLYIKHADIFKYSGDQEDKEWLFAQGRMSLTGGRTYMLLYDDIKYLSESPEYVNTPMLMHILEGFTVTDWMLEKIRIQMSAQRTDKKTNAGSRSGTPNVTPTRDSDIILDGDDSLDQFEFGKLPFSGSRSRDEQRASPANTDLDLLSNADDQDLSPLARSQHFDVSPMPDVSPSPSDLDGIDDEPPLSATFDLAY